MRTSLIAAIAFSALVAGAAAARADDFNGQQQQTAGASASLDQQSTDSELSDPTARNSIRSHGNH